MFPHELMEVVRAAGFSAWLIALTLFGVGAILGRFIAPIRGYLGERLVRKVIRQLGLDARHNVIVTDAKGIHTEIDHLIRLPAGIVVLETKNYLGAIFGTQDDKTWTVAQGPRRKKIQNPLRQNYRHVATMKEKYPEVDFLNLVCFVSGRFPKGLPSGVTDRRSLAAILKALVAADVENPAVETTWRDICDRADAITPEDRRLHIEQLRDRFRVAKSIQR